MISLDMKQVMSISQFWSKLLKLPESKIGVVLTVVPERRVEVFKQLANGLWKKVKG